MQDLTGNRIDETLYLRDYSFTDANVYGWEMIKYDDATKTATLRILSSGREGLNGRKVTFSLGSFLGKRRFDTADTGINLADVPKAPDSETIPYDRKNIGGGDEEFLAGGTVLKPDRLNLPLPGIDFVHISNLGFIDGRLHIQTRRTRSNIDNSLDGEEQLFLADWQGNPLNASKEYTLGTIHFGIDEAGNTNRGFDYKEYIFDLKNLNPKGLKVMGDFETYENRLTGPWEATFKIESVRELKTAAFEIKFDTWTAKSISLSQMGIILKGETTRNSQQTMPFAPVTILVGMGDGRAETYQSPIECDAKTGSIKVHFTSSLPWDISKIQSVTVNGTTIDF